MIPRKNLLAFLLLCALAALMPTSAIGQTLTQVSATITDPNGLPYSNATVVIQLVGGASTPQTTPCAQSPCFVTNPPAFQTDASGVFRAALWANASITPGGTTWQFNVLEPGVAPPWGFGPKSFSVSLTIAGATDDISSSLSTAAPALTPAFGGTGTPCLTNTAIQYDNGGAFGCNANFTYAPASGLFENLNAGVYTNTQINDYSVSTVGAISPATEWTAIGQPGFPTEAMTGAINCQAGATTHQCTGVAGYCAANQNSAGGNSANCVGGYFQGFCKVSGAWCWGTNPIVASTPGQPANLLASETDVNAENAGDGGADGGANVCTGIWGAQPTQSTSGPGNMPCINIQIVGGGHWTAGVACQEGATSNGDGANTGNCIDMGPFASTASSNSQGISMHSRTSTNAVVSGKIFQAVDSANHPEFVYLDVASSHGALVADLPPHGFSNGTSPNSFLSYGSCTLSGGSCSSTFSNAYIAAPVCAANGEATANAMKVTTTTTAVTVTSSSGTDTQAVFWVCGPSGVN